MGQASDDFYNPLTVRKLDAILSDSQIKAQFFELGYGIFNIYRKAYRKYGKLSYSYDPDDKRYMDFMEAEEDIDYINHRNGGKALLKQWFEKNRDYVGNRLFGKKYFRIRRLESMLIDNIMLRDFVYNELVAEFLNFISVLSKQEEARMHKDYGKNVMLKAYERSLDAAYRLYIQKALN